MLDGDEDDGTDDEGVEVDGTEYVGVEDEGVDDDGIDEDGFDDRGREEIGDCVVGNGVGKAVGVVGQALRLVSIEIKLQKVDWGHEYFPVAHEIQAVAPVEAMYVSIPHCC